MEGLWKAESEFGGDPRVYHVPSPILYIMYRFPNSVCLTRGIARHVARHDPQPTEYVVIY